MYSSIILLKGMKTKILISEEIPAGLGDILGRYGSVIKLPPYNKLPRPIASHGDILIFKDRGRLYMPPKYYHENKRLFSGMEVEAIDEELGDKYPNDIHLDALMVGQNLICNEKYTSEKIKEGKRIINVKQGYARCSVCLLGNGAAITADVGLRKALLGLGIDVLEISGGGIELFGYSYGFIGGASAVIGNRVVFFGNIEGHPEGQKILDFVKDHGFEAEYPRDLPLTDLGSAIIVD